MKKIIFLLVACATIAFLSFTNNKKSIVGQWKITYRSGTADAEFRSDGTFKAVDANGAFDINGKYKMKGEEVYISDSTCGTGYWGRYKEVFITDDSVTSTVIEDSCNGRKIVCDGATLKRKKM